MANVYLQTLEEAKAAAEALDSMGATKGTFGEGDHKVDGWLLTQLARNDHEWPDGDWREERTQAVIDLNGQLWIHLVHRSLQEEIDGTKKYRAYENLTPASGEYLRQTDIEGGAFRKIRGAIKNLV